jgi:hypothetical protein
MLLLNFCTRILRLTMIKIRNRSPKIHCLNSDWTGNLSLLRYMPDFVTNLFAINELYIYKMEWYVICIFGDLLRILYSENQAYNEENCKPKQHFYYSKLTWYNKEHCWTNKSFTCLPLRTDDHILNLKNNCFFLVLYTHKNSG